MEEPGKHKNGDDHYDIFISYAHTDDEVLKGDGWVTILHNALRIRAKHLYGKSVKIWRDDALQVNDDFGQEIEDILAKSHAFVSILTPSYINSDWCRKELKTFITKHAERGSSKNLGNKKRIFKVVKTPVDIDKQPPPFEEVLGIDFYRKGTEPPEEFVPSYDCVGSKKDEGAHALNKLAYDIQKLLKQIIKGHQSVGQISKGNIYLADTSSDLDTYRNELARELEDKGYTVLPKVDFPKSVDGIDKQMQQDMKNAICSIHLVGGKYGFIPEDIDRSVVEIQIEKAFSHSKIHPKFFQLIWLSKDKKFHDNRQSIFREKIDYLEFEEGRGDIVKNSFESFKIDMQEKLDALHVSQNTPAMSDHPEDQSIYLIHTKEDRKDIVKLNHYLRNQGYEVKMSVFSGTKDDISKIHREQLEVANGVLIYWGSGDEAWFKLHCEGIKEFYIAKKNDKKLKSVGLIISAPKNEDKDFFLELEDEKSCKAKIILSYDGFYPDSLNDFLLPLDLHKGADNYE